MFLHSNRFWLLVFFCYKIEMINCKFTGGTVSENTGILAIQKSIKICQCILEFQIRRVTTVNFIKIKPYWPILAIYEKKKHLENQLNKGNFWNWIKISDCYLWIGRNLVQTGSIHFQLQVLRRSKGLLKILPSKFFFYDKRQVLLQDDRCDGLKMKLNSLKCWK